MRSLKILILEPDPFQMMALHQMLNAIGVYDVLTTPSLTSAKRSLACRGTVDIAICNPQIKGGDGLALIQHLTAQHEALALILLGPVAPSLIADLQLFVRDHHIRLLGRLHTPVSAVLMRGLLDSYMDAKRHPVIA